MSDGSGREAHGRRQRDRRLREVGQGLEPPRAEGCAPSREDPRAGGHRARRAVFERPQGDEHPLRELRPKRGASPLRIIYAFDPRREALLLLGGDKGNDKRFYERTISRAEQLWEAHLDELEKGSGR